jgi:hypothetical protein
VKKTQTPEMYAPESHGGQPVRIVAIEYQREKSGWKPFQVVTDGGSIYDFDWCEQDGMLAHHMSGFGGDWGKVYTVTKYCAAPKLCSKLWYDHSRMTLKTSEGKPLDDKQARALGVQVIAEPIDGNPFDDGDAIEDKTEYCEQCRARHPDDNMCRHVQWQEDGGGWALGCGASDVDFGETQASLYRLLRMLPKTIVHTMLTRALSRTPPGGSDFDDLDIIRRQHRDEERFLPGVAWLRSLDSGCKEALALTAGWLWMFERADWRACQVVPERRFIRHLSPAALEPWLAIDPLDPGELYDKPLSVRLGFKPQCTNDVEFLKNPLACEEVILWPPRRSVAHSHKGLTLSVAEVKQVSNKAVDIFFGAVIERNGQHISELDGYSPIYL